MTRYFLMIILILPLQLQSQFSDTFSDGDFTSAPRWAGDTSSFEINSQKQLHLKSSGSDTSCLVTSSSGMVATEWSFWLKMSFNTSLNNYTRIYLGSDSPEIKGSVNAFYMQIGGSCDSIVFCRQTGNIHLSLFRVPYLRTNKSLNMIRMKITRDSTGNWEFFADTTGGRIFKSYGRFLDKEVFAISWFGVFCRYTSSNSTKFYFDDFYMGGIIHDMIPPKVISAGFSDSTTVRILFSEPIDSNSLISCLNFSLKNKPDIIRKVLISEDNPEIIFIKINKEENVFFCDSLLIRRLSDFSNNILADTSISLCYYIPGTCLQGDVLFNELLFHPDAAGARFIEFFNKFSRIYRSILEDFVK